MRGLGVGRALGEATIAHARAIGARRVELYTNSSLTPAITLYRALGFVDVAVGKTDFVRADVHMVLDLELCRPRARPLDQLLDLAQMIDVVTAHRLDDGPERHLAALRMQSPPSTRRRCRQHE